MFPNHFSCWQGRADIVALHAIGDGLTALAYYLIPVCLFYTMRRYHFHARLKFVLFVYGTFILLCGTTHLVDLVMIWHVTERVLLFDGWLRVLTGMFSLFSAGVTVYVSVKFLDYATRFFGLTAQMAKERKEFDRVRTETWDEFHRMRNDIRKFLHKNDPIEG